MPMCARYLHPKAKEMYFFYLAKTDAGKHVPGTAATRADIYAAHGHGAVPVIVRCWQQQAATAMYAWFVSAFRHRASLIDTASTTYTLSAADLERVEAQAALHHASLPSLYGQLAIFLLSLIMLAPALCVGVCVLWVKSRATWRQALKAWFIYNFALPILAGEAHQKNTVK
jgi:hypothetical protein